MDNATQTMIRNLEEKTGKSLDEWIAIVNEQSFEKHGQMVKYLKDEHGFTHGFANLVAHKTRGSDAGSVEDKGSLIEAQYRGKEHFKPLYDSLMAKIATFGQDIEVSPKKAYVSLRRKKQFAILQPATKSRFEVALNLRNSEPGAPYEAITSKNAMCSHKASLSPDDSPSEVLILWLKAAYDEAG